MPENALGKLLEVIVVDFGLGAAVLVNVEPAALVDGFEDAWELFFFLWQVDQKANDELVDSFGGDFRWVPC